MTWMPGRRATIVLAALALVGIIVTAAGPAALRAAGRGMAAQPPLQRADLAAVTLDSGLAGELEAIDLLNESMVSRIVVLMAEPGRLDRELRRRGVEVETPMRRLQLLGAPAERVTAVSAGEGGTQAVAMRLADWPASAPSGRILVITSAEHARRVSRSVARHWRGPGPPPAVRVTRYDAFAPDTWWRNRRGLRRGVVELQKLILDYVAHPLN